MAIQWPDLWAILTPCRGKRFALVRDTVAYTMELVDLDRLFVVMSGSKAEQQLNAQVVLEARGDVLLFGFGLGFILVPIMNKPEVHSVTVVELHQEVLDLVASQHQLNGKVRIVLGDCMTYIPNRQYDVIYFDADVTPEDTNEHPHLETRMKPYLKLGGQFLQWENNGNFRS